MNLIDSTIWEREEKKKDWKRVCFWSLQPCSTLQSCLLFSFSRVLRMLFIHGSFPKAFHTQRHHFGFNVSKTCLTYYRLGREDAWHWVPIWTTVDHNAYSDGALFNIRFWKLFFLVRPSSSTREMGRGGGGEGGGGKRRSVVVEPWTKAWPVCCYSRGGLYFFIFCPSLLKSTNILKKCPVQLKSRVG